MLWFWWVAAALWRLLLLLLLPERGGGGGGGGERWGENATTIIEVGVEENSNSSNASRERWWYAASDIDETALLELGRKVSIYFELVMTWEYDVVTTLMESSQPSSRIIIDDTAEDRYDDDQLRVVIRWKQPSWFWLLCCRQALSFWLRIESKINDKEAKGRKNLDMMCKKIYGYDYVHHGPWVSKTGRFIVASCLCFLLVTRRRRDDCKYTNSFLTPRSSKERREE